MAAPDRIEGFAIVSADGMIADARGVQPSSLMPEADQRFFYDALAATAAVVHGAHSSEHDANSASRSRLIVTRRVASVERSSDNARAVLWNPQGASLGDAWTALGLSGGMLAVIGGTGVFGLFLDRGYDAFHLTQVGSVRLPGGRPLFPGIPATSVEQLLANGALVPSPAIKLDKSGSLTLTTWRRR